MIRIKELKYLVNIYSATKKSPTRIVETKMQESAGDESIGRKLSIRRKKGGNEEFGEIQTYR